MKGIIVLKKSGISSKTRIVRSLARKIKSFNQAEADLWDELMPKTRKRLEKQEAAYSRCLALQKDFTVVEIDKEAKRKVNKPDSYSWRQRKLKAEREGKKIEPETIDVPLIWSRKLPISKGRVEKRIGSHRVSTLVPNPTSKAIEQIKEHGKKFDHLEVWWVPNKFNIKAEPPPVRDPILVGVVIVPNDKTYYFELTRWIDESVEDGWWAGEGY